MIQAAVTIIFLGVFIKGLTAVVQTQQHVMVKVGEDVHLSCQLMQTKDVLQVTWQKDLPEGKKNLGSYNKYFKKTVNPGFQDKVEFKDAGLKNCSIVIRKVMEQDEGCYLCLFNTYPDGSLTGRTCLHLYELHEPILQIRESNSSEETVVSCSATGRPAPTVTLNVPQQDLYFSNSSTVSVTNTNATVTVTTTAVLSGGFHGNGAQVGCAVRLLSVPEIQVFKMIPAVNQSSDDGAPHRLGAKLVFGRLSSVNGMELYRNVRAWLVSQHSHTLRLLQTIMTNVSSSRLASSSGYCNFIEQTVCQYDAATTTLTNTSEHWTAERTAAWM
ncbi:OX-2 membrane glycoprotein-like [Scomber japonicus]|uniref:OX-2 membrane glycoprotein-like n=1 Tax=Scomber japonicus TaxID=13676 RepID=UPI00230659AA|nr:OX-2 membrane glycoprotein-like [Scomber japonicus]